ncbi:MAG: sigma-54-dependent transcriptional regulator [Myxococcaceae bacterium]
MILGSSHLTAAAPQVLVVDDDLAVGKVLVSLLEQVQLSATHVASAEEALARLDLQPFDLVLSDLRMAGMDGMALLRKVRAQWPETPFVLLTAHGTVPLAVEAMREGAADFLLKPFDREELAFTVKKALATSARSEPPEPETRTELPEPSPAMAEVLQRIHKVAASMSTVLIRGESGTGKERAARALHAASPRHSKPFVAVHCAALPEALLESELFGYEKGAFSGAAARKPGRVDLAQGGTLFLDEVADISAATQVKLLRLLQEKTFERLGGTETLQADVRFVAATHQPLEERVRQGQFREDLFYRLNVVPIQLPPLRERPEDIAALAKEFCTALGAANQKPKLSLAADALARLQAHDWPGNVRQLQNFIERLVVFSDGDTIVRADVDRELGRHSLGAGASPNLGATPRAATPASVSASTLESHRTDAERRALEEALRRAGGNRTQAARVLGISRRTLYNKLGEYGLA